VANRFTELSNRVYTALRTIEAVGPSDPNIGELGERGVIILDYLRRRFARV
jgi:hypothetical protein